LPLGRRAALPTRPSFLQTLVPSTSHHPRTPAWGIILAAVVAALLLAMLIAAIRSGRHQATVREASSQAPASGVAAPAVVPPKE